MPLVAIQPNPTSLCRANRRAEISVCGPLVT
jgi:hypothetical protein